MFSFGLFASHVPYIVLLAAYLLYFITDFNQNNRDDTVIFIEKHKENVQEFSLDLYTDAYFYSDLTDDSNLTGFYKLPSIFHLQLKTRPIKLPPYSELNTSKRKYGKQPFTRPPPLPADCFKI
ncbi:MAG: hypothetical protein JXA77_19555 [Bacteroidales bacterium]|nr:hypothetical protein [Bacteroidales bacterium]MBN2821526.1 hypothetical protein [Bacteroidales bacterium]